MTSSGVNLLTVEIAIGDRPFELSEPSDLGATDSTFLQLRTKDEIWHKERALNLGIERLPPDWKYVAVLDADIEFIRKDWVEEIIHELQIYPIIQVFQNAIDLGPNGEAMQTHNGFGWSFVTNQPFRKGYPYWHPGLGWAFRREAINDLGGLLDVGILGASDHHAAWAYLGKVIETAPKDISPGYKQALLSWQDRCTKHIKQNIGYMKGTIYHHFHGRKAQRYYKDRWQILSKHGYDPVHDLKFDWQGLYQFTDAGERMRNDIRAYFRSRLEDATDL